MKGGARRQQSSQRRFYVTLGAVALLGVLALIYITSRPSSAPAARTVDASTSPGDAQPYIMGDTTAPVVIMEFADYQCGWCAQFATVTEPDVRRLIVDAGLASYHFYDFPIPGHRNAYPAAHAAACAAEQGKFWEMHDAIFRGQNDWTPRGNPKGTFEEYARAIGLDAARWETCYDERRYQRRIDASVAEGMRRGVSSTPTFIIGNKMLPGLQGYDVIRAYVDSAAQSAGAAAPSTGGSAR